jgi:hypothetical protein
MGNLFAKRGEVVHDCTPTPQRTNAMHPTFLTYFKPAIGSSIPLPSMASRIDASFPKPSDDNKSAK